MSGILGIWNLDGRPVEKATLARLSGTLAHRGPDAEGLWTQGAVGLASRLLRVTPESSKEIQPSVHSSGPVLVFDGRLDNREELLEHLKTFPEVSRESPDPVLVLASYQVFGDRFPERLNGDFALGLFDPRRQKLLLARDAIGIRPLYYHRSRDLFLFASEIKAILAHPQVLAQPNDEFLADTLVLARDCHRGNTCFEGVFSLFPSHLAILTPRGFRTQRYWDFDPARQTRLGSFQEYAEAFRQHFERAVRRRLRSAHPVAVSVSGGLDSSSIFCMAETLRRRTSDHHPPLFGLSYVSPDGTPSDEKAFLLEIERDYGVTIERFPIGPLGLMDESMEVVRQVEVPVLDEQWNTNRSIFRTAHRRGARVLLTGHWGDQVLFTDAYLIDLSHRLAWGQVRSHLKEFGRWFVNGDPRSHHRRFFVGLIRYHIPSWLLAYLHRLRPTSRNCPWYSEAFRRLARFRVNQWFALGKAFHSAHARSLYEDVRTNYHVMCMEWNNKIAAMHGMEMAFPFLDRDLLSFLIGIPGDMQAWRGVPKAFLREGLRGVLPDMIAQRRWKANFTHLVNRGVRQDLPQIARCLESDGMAVRLGYLQADVLKKELAFLKEDWPKGPECVVAWELSNLLALELWLQAFFGERGTV